MEHDNGSAREPTENFDMDNVRKEIARAELCESVTLPGWKWRWILHTIERLWIGRISKEQEEHRDAWRKLWSAFGSLPDGARDAIADAFDIIGTMAWGIYLPHALHVKYGEETVAIRPDEARPFYEAIYQAFAHNTPLGEHLQKVRDSELTATAKCEEMRKALEHALLYRTPDVEVGEQIPEPWFGFCKLAGLVNGDKDK